MLKSAGGGPVSCQLIAASGQQSRAVFGNLFDKKNLPGDKRGSERRPSPAAQLFSFLIQKANPRHTP